MELINPLITIIFLSLIAFILSCDCSQCKISSERNSPISSCTECPSDEDCNCKWFVINETASECLNCDKNNVNDYYARVLTSNNEPFCKSLGISGFPYAKIIKGTHQILSDCKELGLFEIGDECMQQGVIFNYGDFMDGSEPLVEGYYDLKELKCKYKYYIETQNNGLKSYKCLKENEWCPSQYKYIDSETKECLYKCPKDKPTITEIVKNGETYYICSKACDYSEGDTKYDKKFPKKSSLNRSITIDFCYNECPEESHYYYENEKRCIEKCNENDFILLEENRCSNNLFDCKRDSYFVKITSKNLIFCPGDEFNGCPNDYTLVENERKFCTINTDNYRNLQKYKDGVNSVLGCEPGQFIHESNVEKKCLDECVHYDLTKNNRCADSDERCENLFYNDESRGVQICLEGNNCENQKGYPYLIDNENKCNETCNKVLSLDGTKCFNYLNHVCEDNTKNIVKME